MIVERKDIEKFIPQRPPIVMIHHLLEATDKYAVTETAIEEQNIFVESGHFTEPGLIENIAQTAAAQAGYQCHLKKNDVPIGFIASIKDLHIRKLPSVNSKIITRIEITNQVFDVTIFNATIHLGEEEICQGEMRVFIKPT